MLYYVVLFVLCCIMLYYVVCVHYVYTYIYIYIYIYTYIYIYIYIEREREIHEVLGLAETPSWQGNPEAAAVGLPGPLGRGVGLIVDPQWSCFC